MNLNILLILPWCFISNGTKNVTSYFYLQFFSYIGKREDRIKMSTEINYTNHVYPLLGKSTKTDEWHQFSWSFAPSNFVPFILHVYNFTDIQISLPHWQIKQQHFTMKCIAIQRQNSKRNEYIPLQLQKCTF